MEDLLRVPEELDLLHVLPEGLVSELVLRLVGVGPVVPGHEGVEAVQALQPSQLSPALL